MGRIIELCPLHPDRVDLYRDNTTHKLFYMVDGSIRLESRDVFHLRGFGEGPKGLNIMKYAAESIGHAKAMQLFGAAFFGSGANPSGIVESKRPLSPEAIDEIQDRFKRIYAGPKRSNKTMVLDTEMTYRPLSTTPEAAQSVQSQQHMVAEICRWFGVPPHKVQHLLQATFSNIEHQSIEVVTDSIMPWVRRFCDEANRKLLGANRDGVFTHMDLTYLLRGDSVARVARYRGLREIGVLSVDEIRAEEGYTPLGANEGGEKRVMQSQYTTLEKIGEAPEPAAVVTPPAPGIPEQPPQDDTPPTTNVVYINDPRFRDIEERLAAARAEIAELRANTAKPQDITAVQNTALLAARTAAGAVDATADLDIAFKRLDDYVKLLPRGFDVDTDGGVHVLNYTGAVDRIIRPPIAGKDGASVVAATVDADTELILELSDGKVLNAGKVTRPRARRKKVNGHAAHV
jgi:HK97 family phage portal protein